MKKAVHAGYNRLIGKPKTEVMFAQRTLVEQVLLRGLEALYDHAQQHRMALEDTITFGGAAISLRMPDGKPCQEPQDMLRVLERHFPNRPPEHEYLQLRAFNILAHQNGLDLSLKSSGAKTPKSIQEKMARLHMARDQLRDVARITTVSSDPAMLDRLEQRLLEVLPSGKAEPWEMTRTGVMKKSVLAQTGGIPTEVQMVPREQARVAARITHKFYQAVRAYDHYMLVPDAQMKAAAVQQYNRIAELINPLISDTMLAPDYWTKANKMLKSMDSNSLALDESSEGGLDGQLPLHDVARRFNPAYTPILKSNHDLQIYRGYLRKMAPYLADGVTLPLPTLAADAPDEVCSRAFKGLTQVTLLTHACFMQQAKPAMRRAWVECAQEINATRPGAISAVVLRSVAAPPDMPNVMPRQNAKRGRE